MPSALIQKFKKMLGAHPVSIMRGPMSPLLLSVPWRILPDHPLPLLTINKGRDSLMVLDETEYYAIAIDRFRSFYEKRVTLDELFHEYNDLSQRIDTLYKEIAPLSLGELSEKELIGYLGRILAIYYETADKTLYIETIDYDKILSVIGTSKKAMLDSIWQDATHPTFISFEGRRLGLLIQGIETATGKDLIQKIKYIYTDYIWTKTDLAIETSLTDIRNNLADRKAQYMELEKVASIRKSEHDAWKQNLDPDARSIAEYMQMVMLFRDVRKDPLARIHTMMVDIGRELIRRAGIDAALAPSVLSIECMKGIAYLAAQKTEIEKRKNGYIAIIHIDDSYEIELYDFEKALEEFNKTLTETANDHKELKGQIANKGKVQGTVRIVLDPHHPGDFKKGDILVTSMTRPEFVHLMKLSGGVITDEGGITCHAAIVSRELNIPCITGTKNATRMLKDGQVVELDANTGIVRIL